MDVRGRQYREEAARVELKGEPDRARCRSCGRGSRFGMPWISPRAWQIWDPRFPGPGRDALCFTRMSRARLLTCADHALSLASSARRLDGRGLVQGLAALLGSVGAGDEGGRGAAPGVAARPAEEDPS